MDAIINLISAVVGGVLGALGTFIVGRPRHKEQLVEKNNAIKRQKVELMVSRALELQDWLLRERDYLLYKAAQPEGSCPINDIVMIASLYTPEGSDITDRLRVVVLDFRTWIAKAGQQVKESGKIGEESANEFKDIGKLLHYEVQNLVRYGAFFIKQRNTRNK